MSSNYLWAVAKNGLVPPRKYEILNEAAKTIVLEDGTVVRKCEMQNNYQLFYASEEIAQKRYEELRSVFDSRYETAITRFDTIKQANIDMLPNILFDMIQEICEDGMPTHDEIKKWLLLKADEPYERPVE